MVQLFNFMFFVAAVISSLVLLPSWGEASTSRTQDEPFREVSERRRLQQCIPHGGYDCWYNSDCCDSSDICMDGYCVDCHSQGEYCYADSDCCDDLTCGGNYECQEELECTPHGQAGCIYLDCCDSSDICMDGYCLDCHTQGMYCYADSDCCDDLICGGNNLCQEELDCIPHGQSDCNYIDCCERSDVCIDGYCFDCRTEDQYCSGDDDCCDDLICSSNNYCMEDCIPHGGYGCEDEDDCCERSDDCIDGYCNECSTEGEYCSGDHACCDDLTCSGNSQCEEECEFECCHDDHCSGDQICSDNPSCLEHTCVHCDTDDGCSSGQYCDCGTGECLPLGPICSETVGASCVVPEDCCAPLVCVTGACAFVDVLVHSCSHTVGDFCLGPEECCEPLECDMNQCVALAGRGPEPQDCDDDFCFAPDDCCQGFDCQQNRCVNGTAASFRMMAKSELCGVVMEPCDSTSQCCEGYVCNGVHPRTDGLCVCAGRDEGCEFVQCCAGFYCTQDGPNREVCEVCHYASANDACQEHEECCDGYCDLSAVTPTCKPCVDLLGTCSENAECCEGYLCINGQCTCGGVGAACPPFDCCTPVLSPLHCKDGFCVACVPTLGGVCEDDDDCCYGPEQYCDTSTGICRGCHNTGPCTTDEECCQGYCNAANECAECIPYANDCDPNDSKCCDKLYCDPDALKCLCSTDICSPDIPCCEGLTCDLTIGECQCAGMDEDCRVLSCCEGLGCDNTWRCNCAELFHDCAFVDCCDGLICNPINWTCIEPRPDTPGPVTPPHIHIHPPPINIIIVEPEPVCSFEHESCRADGDCCYSWLYCNITLGSVASGTCEVNEPVAPECHGYAGAREELPRDAVQVFYFPRYSGPTTWFHWNTVIRPGGGQYSAADDDLPSPFYPRLGPYNSADAGVIETHMDWISEAGIGVVILSWRGEGSYEDRLVWNILAQADTHNLAVAFYIEPPVIDNSDGLLEDYIKASVAYLIDTYGCHRAVYKRENRLVMLFSKAALGTRENVALWKSVWDDLAIDGYQPVVIAPSTDLAEVIDGGWDGGFEFECSQSFSMIRTGDWDDLAYGFEQGNKILYMTVCPGSNKKKRVDGAREPEVFRVDGAAYDRSWLAANVSAISLSANPVAINSFNEWHIGTSIEPATPKTIDSYELNNETIEGFTYEDYDNAYGLTGSQAEFAYTNKTKEHADEYILKPQVV